MDFVTYNGPYVKDKDNTTKIMRTVMTALLPIFFFAFYKNGIMPYQNGYITFVEALYPLFILLTAMITTFLSELLYARFIYKKKKEPLKFYMKHSYALMPGLFLALIIPINTPLWIVVLGSVFATVIGKMIFGGFGYNIFNPALMGSLFITVTYGAYIAIHGGYLNAMEIDTISKATPLTNLHQVGFVGSWETIGSHFGSLWDYFFGFIPGSIGETSKILILMAMIYLILNKIIKWRIPVLYLSTVFILTSIIGAINNVGIWYPFFHLLSGGLMFGAVFMATDPVTSPITKPGQLLYGISLGIMTVGFRFLTPYPEGVLWVILMMNLFVFLYDKKGVKAKFNNKSIVLPLSVLVLIGLGLSIYIGNKFIDNNNNKGNEIFNIINKNEQNNMTIYTVTVEGFHGLIKADVTIENDLITNINVLEQNETYWSAIEKNNYLNKLIDQQANINKLDTVSGATVSSQALKTMIIEVLNDYKK